MRASCAAVSGSMRSMKKRAVTSLPSSRRADPSAPAASFRCADGGYLHITASDQHWLPLCRALGLEAWGSDAGLAGNSGRLQRRDEVMARLGAWLLCPALCFRGVRVGG